MKYAETSVVAGAEGGFSPENVERIYRGLPALVDGQEPGALLREDQITAVLGRISGLTLEEVAATEDVGRNAISQRVLAAYRRLGVRANHQAAGYFPLDPDSPLLEGKRLADLVPGQLDTLQGFSMGFTYEQLVPADSRYTLRSRRKHTGTINSIWPDVHGGLMGTAVVNALRAKYVKAVEGPSGLVQWQDIDALSLPELVEVEPVIVRAIEVRSTMEAAGIRDAL
jgi:hypothetical protein